MQGYVIALNATADQPGFMWPWQKFNIEDF